MRYLSRYSLPRGARNVNSPRVNQGLQRYADYPWADSSMADVTGPILVVVGGDTKRLQWLTHHVTSHWPSAQVTTLRAGESAPLSRLISRTHPRCRHPAGRLRQ